MPRLPLICLALSIVGSPALGQALCDEMWGERNAIYFDAGYCFKTARAKAAFGDNADCRYENIADVPLTARQRADIAAIQQRERKLGCPR
ncbi:hypothetical protein ASE63_06885 [Bosea sp. Root381]|uniref:YARHG domain-containing protein n=1 Tax=Bosea sp. Root381 TaxID=1736524 RepID=UPI0006F3C033|nr:YARHG domain-containing protein [Bosea sp. Root381]KRE02095.1 hypothetical protein ASE63_06885 [Bosea sp. Root381]